MDLLQKKLNPFLMMKGLFHLYTEFFTSTSSSLSAIYYYIHTMMMVTMKVMSVVVSFGLLLLFSGAKAQSAELISIYLRF